MHQETELSLERPHIAKLFIAVLGFTAGFSRHSGHVAVVDDDALFCLFGDLESESGDFSAKPNYIIARFHHEIVILYVNNAYMSSEENEENA